MRRFLCLSLILFHFSLAAKQIVSVDKLSVGDSPQGLHFKLESSPDTIVVLPTMDITTLSAKAKNVVRGEAPYQFAQAYTDQSLWEKNGVWTISAETSIYRMTFVASNALSLNVGLEDVFLPKGGKLFFYNQGGDQIAAFDESDNKSHGQLWSPVLSGNQITLEINVPTKAQSQTQFTIKQVSQGFRSIEPNALKSGDCNINTICPEGEPWRDEINSVARIVINGSSLCTGTLVNNVEEDRTPYFLTANHCGITPASAPTIVFFWNFEASLCDLNTAQADGSLAQFQTGSTYRASYEPTDMALVELDDSPEEFGVYYAGWNNSKDVPTSAVAIHHPNGDEKRISFDNNSLTVTEYLSDITNSSASHLRVGAWELGTTESGSSGSAIWDEDKFIVGTLRGGFASCTAIDSPDWYGRFSSQWEGSTTTDTQLKPWLDPNDTGTETLAGLGACDAPVVTLEVDQSQLVFGEIVNATASASGGSEQGFSYAWDINADGSTDFTGQAIAFSYDYFFQGNVSVTVTDSESCPATERSAITVESGSEEEIFTPSGAIPDEWIESSGSNSPWSMVSGDAFEGEMSLRSGAITDDQNSSIETSYNFTNSDDNFIAFAVMVSSEENFDFFRFYIDDQLMMSLSGIIDWQTVRFPVSQGEHNLRWEYEKDSSVSTGSDSAWIDGVTGIELSSATVDDSDASTDTSTDITTDTTSTSDSGGGAINYWVILMLVALSYSVRRKR